ncbi:uncharacterized protein LOC132699217 isoform X2 [Cylas formicarius]|uniref:uncharacterized protein LOC132699217 isoform X2 n=1 Tax=Cylas formicarius TaxID=197179 RepID=UPI002958A9DD|nr:uncharacterized protein LOC132699217 isoform X2 [Cylas formicarius]
MASQGRFPCEGCGRGYLTAASLAQHQRRYCRGPVEEDPSGCGECGRAFATYAGLRQPMRRAHPDAYNRSVELVDRRRADPVSELERSAICPAELEYGGTAVNKHLAEKFHRTVDVIKNFRKQKAYCSLRARLEAEQKEAPDHPTHSPARFDRPSQASPLRLPSPPARPRRGARTRRMAVRFGSGSITDDQSVSPPPRRDAPSPSPPSDGGDAVFRAGPSSSSSASSAPSSAASSPGAPAAPPAAAVAANDALSTEAAPGGAEAIREYISGLAAQEGVSGTVKEIVGRITNGVGDAAAALEELYLALWMPVEIGTSRQRHLCARARGAHIGLSDNRSYMFYGALGVGAVFPFHYKPDSRSGQEQPYKGRSP